MKKIVFIIIGCLIGIFAQAQETKGHLKFMGIELNGNISDFQTKLQAKGLTVSPLSKLSPAGTRLFYGPFSGEDAKIFVWYNLHTKEVYRAKAIIGKYEKNIIEQKMKSLESKLDTKYGIECKESGDVKDDYNHKFTQHAYLIDNGEIDLYIVSEGYTETSNNFSIHVDYWDKVNRNKNTQDEMDDL